MQNAAPLWLQYCFFSSSPALQHPSQLESEASKTILMTLPKKVVFATTQHPQTAFKLFSTMSHTLGRLEKLTNSNSTSSEAQQQEGNIQPASQCESPVVSLQALVLTIGKETLNP
jgi:hypothetical protein